MKQKIFADSRRRHLTHNIKLGEGGIREAEFFVQYFQLIHGGHAPNLQDKNWCVALNQLTESKQITVNASEALEPAYFFLRKVEHGLQQMRNEQTQTLPDQECEEDWTRLALYTQSSSIEELKVRLQNARNDIDECFNQLFNEPTPDQADHSNQHKQFTLLWLGDYERTELSDALLNSFLHVSDTEQHESLATELIVLKQKSVQAHLSSRAQLLVDELVPSILEEVSACTSECKTPINTIFSRISAIIASILGRTTYLELINKHNAVRQQLISFCSLSPWLADQLKQFPLLLDELLSQTYTKKHSVDIEQLRANYQDELRQELLRVEPDDVEHHMNVLRQFKLCQQFRIAASDIHGSMMVEQVSDTLTVLAEVILQQVIETAYVHMVKKYGEPDHSETPIDNFAVLAYGKMGGFELGYGSDLDLVLIHDSPSDSHTTGTKSIGAQQFYIKVAQRAIHLMNTKTLLGELYEIDLRLRPAGNAGLLCCHLNGFTHYQESQAWTWEHQALVRTRVVFGGPAIREKLIALRKRILTSERDKTTLIYDLVSMRKKLFEHSKKQFDKDSFKHGKGGITDIEFISQYLVLANANVHSCLTEWPDNLRIIQQALNTHLIDEHTAAQLSHSYLLQRNEYHRSLLAQPKSINLNASLSKTRETVFKTWQAILPDYTDFL